MNRTERHDSSNGSMPKTSSPGLNRATPMPTASTTPETSQPSMSSIRATVGRRARFLQSVGLTPGGVDGDEDLAHSRHRFGDADPLDLSELAEQPHMSLRTFARRFNEEVGMS